MSDDKKTNWVAWLCTTMIILGILFVLSKANACALACNSCGSTSTPVCKDQFYEIKNDGYASDHTCYPGARVEFVSSPPSPKPGILCHCINNDQAAQAVPDAGR